MRVAVVQFAAGRDKRANLERLRALVADAADTGAQLVVCPEASMHTFGRPTDPPLAEVAEPLDGAFVTGLAETAVAYGVTVVAGMFETVDRDRSRAFNTVVALGPHGVIGRSPTGSSPARWTSRRCSAFPAAM
jgi:predicted amidohydrolase